MTINLKTADKILIIPKQSIDIDSITASIYLAQSLVSERRHPDIYLNKNNYPEIISKKFPLHGLRGVDLNLKKNYKISIEEPDLEISNIEWKREGDKTNILIHTNKGIINKSSAEINSILPDYDAIVVVGFQDLNTLGDIYKHNKDTFRNENVFYIDNKIIKSKENQYYYETNSLSEVVYYFVQKNDLLESKQQSTNLLAGMYWKTNNLRTISDNNIFQIIDELINSGADLQKAVNKSNNLMRLIDTKLIKTILENLIVSEGNIAFSKIDKNTAKMTDLSNMTFRDWQIIQYLNDAQYIIFAIEKENGCTITITTNNHKDMKQLSESLHAKIINEKIIYTSEKTPEEELDNIRKLINGYSDGDEPAQTNMNNQELTDKHISEKEVNDISQVEKAKDNKSREQTEDLENNKTISKDHQSDDQAKEDQDSDIETESYNPNEYDPLSPAISMPEPLDLNKASKVENSKRKSPLP